MIISINQPGYLPWAGYFDRIAKSDLHVVLDHVQFEKNSFVNRNQILGQAGPFWLTVPVRTKGRFGNLSIVNLEIETSQFWRRKHLESIRSSYSRSPFFGEYWEPLKARIDGDQVLLAELCRSVTGFLLECLHIDVPIHFSSDHAFQESKSGLVLEICRHFNATRYLSGPFGREYLDLDAFEKAGIEVEFHDYEPEPYPQSVPEFVPNLSVVDLLFNMGPKVGVQVRGSST